MSAPTPQHRTADGEDYSHVDTTPPASGLRRLTPCPHRAAIQRVEKNLQYAYRDRRTRKRVFRSLWIQRINAAARENGTTYSKLINSMSRAGILMDRKVLADLAVKEPESFKALVEQARGS